LIKFNRYKEISLKFYTLLLSYADELQAVSVDEALLDVSHAVANLKVQMLSQYPENVERDFSKVLAEQIRERILGSTGCQGSQCSVSEE
jgi:DNA repair protein REV1